jgi:transaldolase / glucose-6-phosphate isomerase
MVRRKETVMNGLRALQGHGQSPWLDYIRRGLVTSGELARLVSEDGLRGVTSNPAIFEKAIAGSSDYAAAIQELAPRCQGAKELYERLAIRDVQDAADALRGVYDETGGRDGYVSLEVSPALSRDTRGTVEEARRLWNAVDRPNAMIKVPATPEGIPAIETLLTEGLNVNVTLLFSLAAYERVARAYLGALERRAALGRDVSRVASVASFFVSRIDAVVDGLIEERLAAILGHREQAVLRGLLGQVAIANAKLAYRRYQELFGGDRWRALAHRGARTQRVLWASTGTKNAAYRDVRYVEELIGPDTVNTIPPATYDAFREHGLARETLTRGYDEAEQALETLAASGISLDDVTDRLLDDGVRLFVDAFEKLLAAVERARTVGAPGRKGSPVGALPGPIAAAAEASVVQWSAGEKVHRLWARDAALWTGADEASWLGWLGVSEGRRARAESLRRLGQEAADGSFTDAVVLGMGGSSLCPEVMSSIFGPQPAHPRLRVLDSTDPAQIRALEAEIDLARTLFVVSSKSGGTLEPNILAEYFFERVRQAVAAGAAGRRFVAVTDPGSRIQAVAERDGFRHVFPGVPSIGGRYSALSNFGLVPSAIMGLDVSRLLERAETMMEACRPCVPVAENPGVRLGIALGEAARHGRDKVTFVASPRLRPLGAWVEQLLAESTGKAGRGLIPVDGETTGSPSVYGDDRMFVHVRLDGDADAGQEAALAALERAGHPVVRIPVADPYDLGQEFFRWEMATAVAGSILGVNPFDQPDVEASKVATRRLTAEYEERGALPEEVPFFEGDGVKLFADPGNAEVLRRSARGAGSLEAYLAAHLARLRPGDYFALLAYVHMSPGNGEPLQAMRLAVRDAHRVATCLGFGPRFLHSTGQAYKGGPNTGVFLQITGDDADDLAIPGRRFTFGAVKAAQARGDLQVLAERGRRALRVHLGADTPAGLERLRAALARGLARAERR